MGSSYPERMNASSRRRVPFVLCVIVATWSSSACSSEPEAACAEMRAELTTLTPAARQAWDDISELQKSVARAQQLRAEIEERCG